MRVRVYVTGRVRIEAAGRLIDEQQFPGRQGRVLFAYLVCHRQRPTTRGELAEILWPGALPPAWESALNALVSKLRAILKRIQPASRLTLNTAFGAYVLHVADDVWIDREAAAASIDEAEGLLHGEHWREAWGPSNIAAIAARQPFLAGDEGEWIDQERASLRRILLRALDCLTEVWLRNDEPALALALEPFREVGYRRLMRIHVSLGERAEALRVYEECRLLLAKELGAEPSPETQAVWLDVRGGVGPARPDAGTTEQGRP